ncbi:MAG TPA: ABC transporter permease subunit [Anaerolineae bacterium]|jgi:ABC-type sugar transport system permease subunit|nr:ABC transporter permease subunit [Anaerolineae bacterium]
MGTSGEAKAPRATRRLNLDSGSLLGIVVRLVLLATIDAFAIWFILNLISDGVVVLAVAVGLVTFFINVVVLRNDAYPIRWMLLGLVLMAMFAIYPILFTVFVAFTNFGDGHLFTKEQAIEQLEKVRYLPEGGGAYSWTAFRSGEGDFVLWLQGEDGSQLLARPDQPIAAGISGEEGVGELDGEGIPETIEGYERLNRLTVVRYIDEVGDLTFGVDEDTVQIRSLDAAAALQQRYVYDPEEDVIVDQETGEVYTPVQGTFTSTTGDELIPGFRVGIGLQNFRSFFQSPALRGPMIRIILWNFAFAFFSVFLTFTLGLAIALIFSDPQFPGRKLITTLLIIPYTIPSLITILVWRGMLQPDIGVINRMLEAVIGWAPAWFTNPWWAKAAVLLLNTWLGYPYFLLVCTGALQAIPRDIYSAAEVDGANVFQRFRRITLPLLLVAVGPLLVASFVFNFNNFNVIFVFIEGGPPIAGAITRAGHTDIMISYVFNLAFNSGRGADYGLASAITIVIFLVVAVITLLQFRYTKMWEEVGENV